jgi:cytochrome c biogenesis protein CcdA/thiol-disulfide isomerase/thioredoxin
MNADIINTSLAFIEGFALIISPCILPILPFILSASLTGNKSRPFGIIVGFVTAFSLVTLFSRQLIGALHIDPNTLQNASFVLLILLGMLMMSTYLTEKFTLLTQRLANVGSSFESVSNPNSGLWGGVLFGMLIGIIWTPCAGPILAAVIVQVVIQKTTLQSVLTVVAFALGAGLPMLLIAIAGRKIIDRFAIFRTHTVMLRKLLGLIIIVSSLMLMSGLGTYFSTTNTVNNNLTASHSLVNGLAHPYPAPKLLGISDWINTAPLELSQLKGKVVLIDFWTYSCINCLRTLPYLKDWYAKYHDLGLDIIGIHSPEFSFEHDLSNVQQAVKKEGILYPVGLDNQFVTWQLFNNKFWPAHYLINKNGDVVYEHFGEGEYDVTENNIRFLLGLSATTLTMSKQAEQSVAATPETYLGYQRQENYFSNEIVVKNGSANYSYPALLPEDGWALQGRWQIAADRIVSAQAGASIKLHFKAGKVYGVMGVVNGSEMTVRLRLNDQDQGMVSVNRNQLYTLLSFKKQEEGTLELIAPASGLEIYTFTFG